MLTDRYGLALSTASAAARDAYVEAADLALTLYPGAVEAFDRAIAADPGFALAHAGKAQVLMREGQRRGGTGGPGGGQGRGRRSVGARGQSHRVLRPCVRGPDRRRDRRLVRASGGMAARRAGGRHRREPQRPDRRLRPHRTEAPDRGADGQPRAALRRRFLVPVLSCHGAVRGWTACAPPAEDRAIRGAEPEQRAWRAWLRACLLRERRAEHGPHLPVLLARHLSARRLFPWPSELASLACAKSRPAIGNERRGSIGTPSRSTGTAAGRNRKCRMGRRFCGVPNSPAIRATPPPGARCTIMRTARCRGRAAGSPICTSSWRRRSWAMTPRSTPEPARWRSWRARVVTRPAPTFRRWRAASRRSNAGIFPARSRRLRRSPGQNERIGGSRAQHDLIEFTLLKAYLDADRLEEARHLLRARRPGAPAFRSRGLH